MIKNLYKLFAKTIALFLAVTFLFLNFVLPVIQAFSTREAIIRSTQSPVPKERSFLMANLIFDNFSDFGERTNKYFQYNNGTNWIQDKTKPLDSEIWTKARYLRGFAVSNFIGINSYERFINPNKQACSFFIPFYKRLVIEEYEVSDNDFIVQAVVSGNMKDFKNKKVVCVDLYPLSQAEEDKIKDELIKDEEIKKCFTKCHFEIFKCLYEKSGEQKTREVYSLSPNVDSKITREIITKASIDPTSYLGETIYEVKESFHKELQVITDVPLKIFMTRCHVQNEDEETLTKDFNVNNDFVNGKLNEKIFALKQVKSDSSAKPIKAFYLEDEKSLRGETIFTKKDSPNLVNVRGLSEAVSAHLKKHSYPMVMIDGKIYNIKIKIKSVDSLEEEVKGPILAHIAKLTFDYRDAFRGKLIRVREFMIGYVNFWVYISNFLNYDNSSLIEKIMFADVNTTIIPSFNKENILVMRFVETSSEEEMQAQSNKVKLLLSSEMSAPFTERARFGYKNPKVSVN